MSYKLTRPFLFQGRVVCLCKHVAPIELVTVLTIYEKLFYNAN